MADTEFDNPMTLIGELAIAYRALGAHGGTPLVCVRLRDVDPARDLETVDDGDMLRVVDVTVTADEAGAHIEIIVIPDGADPTIVG